jgi:N-acetyl-anhydromuramyl-L-alanine amidase AmpD
MNIVQDHRIFEKYFEPVCPIFRRALSQITGIIIHGSGGPDTAKGVINWMLAGGAMADGTNRTADYKKGVGLFHYEIDSNGDIYQLIQDIYFVYHSSSGRNDASTVGIELIQKEKNNSGKYSIEQYDSLFTLIKSLMILCPIKIIAGHGGTKLKYTGSYKNCPGEKFDWISIINNFNLQAISKEVYEIIS